MTMRKIDVHVPVIIPVTFLYTQQSDLFDGISFFIDASLYVIIDGIRKYPQKLGKVIVVNGGEVHPKFNPEETTYILSKGLPEFRIPNFHVSQLISPDWISHCVERQRILETKEFLLIDLQQIFGDNNDNDNTSSESEEEERIESAEKQSSSKTGKRRGRPPGKSRNRNFSKRTKREHKRISLEERRAQGKCVPTPAIFFPYIRLEDLSKRKTGQYIIKAKPVPHFSDNVFFEHRLYLDSEGLPIYIMPLFRSEQNKSVLEAVTFPPKLLNDLCTRAGVEIDSILARDQDMDLFSSAYNILKEFIKNKKRVYFAIDWNKENGTMILTNFGTEEEITEELN